MPSSRRELIRKLKIGGAFSLIASISGCLNVSDWSEDRNDHGNNGSVGELSIPNPIIEEVVSPDLDIKSSSHDEGDDTFNITVENSGSDGVGVVELFWLIDDGEGTENVSRDDLEFYDSEEIDVDPSSTTEISFSGVIPDAYDGFWFIVSSVSVSAGILNRGGEGEVSVELKDDSGVVDSTIISIRRDETVRVDLRGSTEQQNGDFDVSASPVES